MNRLFVATHAAPDINTNSIYAHGGDRLTESSQLDVDAILNKLVTKEIDPQRCILMSSVVRFAVETGRELKEELGIPTLVKSPQIRKVSLWPEPVRDVPGFLADVARATVPQPDVDGDVDLVVISHGNLPRLISGTPSVAAPHGQVYEVPHDWENPMFDPVWAAQVDAHEAGWIR